MTCVADVVRGDPCRAGVLHDRDRTYSPKISGMALMRASHGHQVPTEVVAPRHPGWGVRLEGAPCNAVHQGGSLPCGVSLVEG